MKLSRAWMKISPDLLPFADAASETLPLGRMARLSLFQVSVGMVMVLLIGTLNRVMIVELGVPTWLVAVMVALPVVFAPFRALIGFRSDQYKSVLGWKRVPYIWFGSVWVFGGLAMMPFALIILSGDTFAPPIVGQVAAGLAFLIVGAGLHTVQTAGLALATDLSPVEQQPRVVAFLSVALLLGMLFSALIFGALLADFSQLRLIQVIQGAAVVSIVLTLVAVWKQEVRNPVATAPDRARPAFQDAWDSLRRSDQWVRRLTAVGIGSVAFSMQDVLLEPYGGQILGLSVSQTTLLTAGFAAGGIAGFVRAAKRISAGGDAHRVAAMGALIGAAAFAGVIAAAPAGSGLLFAVGAACIGYGGGLFLHATLTACMRAAPPAQIGLALGTWGAVQATCAGGAIAIGGVLRDTVSGLALRGSLGEALATPVTGYVLVYLIEIVLLFATMAAIGPLVRPVGTSLHPDPLQQNHVRIGLAGPREAS
ncbi:MFS transporter [Paracraurococcus ruber]|uniref:MFS transporter n=1 Tax=Paracraurococcus ruber TaxID=77675 RepID=A0ABS1CTT7_9PROT|nr:MFS transporter [Paracraurococcus ruber]MBK1657882.1 MFS transporter [Paracraurococcus ruber]TDG32438.1 MFS transporter [Paracraurococcus ruber]